jgi:hypothetical protein
MVSMLPMAVLMRQRYLSTPSISEAADCGHARVYTCPGVDRFSLR